MEEEVAPEEIEEMINMCSINCNLFVLFPVLLYLYF